MKVLITSIIAALLLLNCKKSILVAEPKPAMVFTKQPATLVEENGQGVHLLYDQDNRLLAYTSAEVTNYYKPGNDHFLTQLYKESGEKIIFRHAQTDEQGRITKLEKQVKGVTESNIEFTYDNNGFLISKKVISIDSNTIGEYTYAYNDDNLTKIEEYENAVLKTTVLFDYYDSRVNSTHIDLFDHKQIGFVTDKQFGHESKNLVKSVKAVTPGAQTGIAFQYSYKTDANGYVRSMEIETNSETLKKYHFIFQ
jgi:hypothetical protein